ncbi:MAG: M3 family oligoendopeptidase [Abditibacteriales bacterium]|nr:M3 family oligoendopeptidase [Abditibacteriales bacterium]MDW8365343.1 M3 family oligoendopeptidase [Abditibacteriales bacterium]
MSALKTDVTWDLSDLYAGVDDPKIESDVASVKKRAEEFESKYRGRIAVSDLTAATLRDALDEYEALLRDEQKPSAFAYLHFSTDTTDPARGALLQKMQEAGTEIATHLIFFDLEIGKIPQETYDRLIGDTALDPYRHYLQHQRALAAHYLSEAEEKILEETANSGPRAFGRLFTEITARQKFRVTVRGEEQELTQSEILALLYDPDRAVRQAAAASFTEGLKEHHHVLHFIFNTLLHDKAVKDRLRRYAEPEEARHLDNELSKEVVQNVVEVCVENYGVVADYYHLKRRLLGLDELTHYDRYAPILDTQVEISFDEAREMVLNSFRAFSPQVYDITEPFFSKRWIDAAVKPGKAGGAYCSSVSPDWHPYVFMNYTGKPRDVMTLAHELGHGIHGVLACKQNLLNFHASLPMAETASVFGEMLVFEALQKTLTDPKEKLALLAEKIEDTFATVFRQVAMFRFEQAVHRARRAQGELTVETVNQLWQTHMQEMFQDSLRLGDDHAWWWLYIPHIFQSPFYVYAYAFGELLVLALYARYRQEGEPFIQKYLNLLAAGGSDSPPNLLKAMDIDIADRAFWQGGARLIRQMVEQAQELARLF